VERATKQNLGILLIGKLGSGKSTVGKLLNTKYNCQQHSMAKWLKDTIINHYKLKRPLQKNAMITLGTGETISVRKVLQLFGTECIRNFDPHWHIDEIINDIDAHMMCSDHKYRFVIDDVRFKNEIRMLTDRYNCVTIRVEGPDYIRDERVQLRDGHIPNQQHVSENELNDFITDYNIVNDGDLKDLEAKLGDIMLCILMKQ
jgi:ABC-type dipeptide/oligopeptide/nickel transport system ATPase subunit